MTATPDSFSLADLEALYEDAVREEDITPEVDPDDCSQEFITSTAATALDELMEPLSGKQACMVEKVILHLVTQRMIEWHSRVGAKLADDSDSRSSVGWSRDAGKFQAILCILDTIGVSDDDFTCSVGV